MSDQLAESSKELEMELREELDMALAAAQDAQRQRDAALETLSDREMTIVKFRELTQKLQEQCLELQNRLQSTESTKTAAKGTGEEGYNYTRSLAKAKLVPGTFARNFVFESGWSL